ncbi:MAG: cupin domain-containing protein [Patescibacteria group bacterium UBA2163]
MYYNENIEKTAIENENFRTVLYTDPRLQLVVMSLKPGEEIGMEVHNELDQFVRIEAGEGKAILDDQEFTLGDGSVVIVPKGTNHNIVNTSTTTELKLYTIYTPPEHAEGVVHATKAEADADDEHYHG